MVGGWFDWKHHCSTSATVLMNVLSSRTFQPPAAPDRMSLVSGDLGWYTHYLDSAFAPECAINRLSRSSFEVFGFG